MAEITFPVCAGAIPSVAISLAAFNKQVRPLERAARTSTKYETHYLSVLTWKVWKDVLSQLLPMSDDLRLQL
jgi:hypothetical protein